MTDDALRRVPLRSGQSGAPAKRSSGTLRSGASAERRTPRSCARREASDGAKRWMVPVVSTTRRPHNSDDGRLGRRRYCVGVGRGRAPGMTTVASDGGGGEKRLWL